MNVGRVVVLFLYCFGVFVVPAAIILPLVILFAPDPYVIRADLLAVRDGAFATPGAIFGDGATPVDSPRPGVPGAIAVAAATYADGGSAGVAAFADPGAARDAIDAALAAIPRRSTTRMPGIATFARADGGNGLLAAVGQILFAVEVPAGADPRERLVSLAAVDPNPEPNFVAIVLFDHWPWSVAALAIYILAQFGIFPRLGSWAARIDPEPGTIAVDGATLRRRLLAINDHDVPFVVRPGRRDDELVVEWRHTDARWAGPMAAGGVRILARIVLRIGTDRARRVRARDSTRTVEWHAGVGAAAGVRWRAFKGIAFKHYDRGRAYGLVFKDGGVVADTAYAYRFDLAEMKNPIVAVVIGSGWSYVPVVTFARIFNGC